MSKKIVHKIFEGLGSPSAKVYKDSEWNEYVVKLYDREGRHLPKGDYFTDDKQDAIGTAEFMVAREKNPMHGRTR